MGVIILGIILFGIIAILDHINKGEQRFPDDDPNSKSPADKIIDELLP